MSKKCKYALKALTSLAQHYNKGLLQAGVMAEADGIPKKFLDQILLDLKRAKIVNSRQGIGGGYYLVKAPSEISVADVYRLFDGPIALTPCASLYFYEKCDDCKDEATCYLRKEFISIREKTRSIMSETTLQSFVDNKSRLLP